MNSNGVDYDLLGKLIGAGVIIGVAFFLLGPFEMGPDISNFLDRTISDDKSTELNDLNTVPHETKPEPIPEERHVGQVFQKMEDDCLISIPDKARTINGKKELTYILPIDDCDYDVNEYVEVVFGAELAPEPETNDGAVDTTDDEIDDSTTPDTTDDDTTEPPGVITKDFSNDGSNITIEPHPDVATYDKLSLTTQREGNDVVFQYYDTSDDTLSVTVVLRNTNEEIFSGVFKSSKFETSVQDVSEDTSHIIDVAIDHAIYGKLYSSVYNPPGENDNVINGMFQKN